MIRKELGSIQSVRFGLDDKDNIGVHFSLGGPDWGVNYSRGAWAGIAHYISDLLHAAKVNDVSKLKGIPIEATFDGNILLEWRILTEVL